jgi:hypothetical protein
MKPKIRVHAEKKEKSGPFKKEISLKILDVHKNGIQRQEKSPFKGNPDENVCENITPLNQRLCVAEAVPYAIMRLVLDLVAALPAVSHMSGARSVCCWWPMR